MRRPPRNAPPHRRPKTSRRRAPARAPTTTPCCGPYPSCACGRNADMLHAHDAAGNPQCEECAWMDRYRQNPAPRKGTLIEVEKRAEGYYFRHPMGHLAGPYATTAKARTAGAIALAAALHPQATRAELPELATALLTEDPSRPYARQFSDGWRVWDPSRRLFLGAAPGVAFASRAEAEVRRRALAGEELDDGPLYRAAAKPAGDLFAPRGGGGSAGTQLGLFGARENPRRRPNPSPLAPLRGGAGELVSYRALPDGRVLVRASVAGAGTSENDMSAAEAERHRARLLRLGYRPNPARRAPRAKRRKGRP